jgi:hypothetical protein
LQKNSEGYEQPIAFFSKALRDAALNYNVMEKQDFALVKAIKDFRVYILHSHVIAYVPNTVVLGPHIVPFLPILFASIIPFITCI